MLCEFGRILLASNNSSSIDRPETPSTSVATEPSLIFASSNTLPGKPRQEMEVETVEDNEPERAPSPLGIDSTSGSNPR